MKSLVKAQLLQNRVARLPRVALAVLWVVIGAGPAFAAGAPTTQPRAARSVHLHYPMPEPAGGEKPAGGKGAAAFYIELTVERSVPGSYFMACGFGHGYFGIQEQANGRKVVLFSVWDPTGGDNPKAVPEEQQVEVLYKADDVTAKRFGGEGTGAQSFFTYEWKPGQAYRFLVRAEAEGGKDGKAGQPARTAYAAWFFLPETNVWKHLATFRTRTAGEGLRGLYSFVEDFRRDGKSAGEVRRAAFGNGWSLGAADGRWAPLGKARFTASNSPTEAPDTIDAGVAATGHFYLQTGGDTRKTASLGDTLERPTADAKPPQVPDAP